MKRDSAIDVRDRPCEKPLAEDDPPADGSGLGTRRIGQDEPLGRLARHTKRIPCTTQDDLRTARPIEIVVETVDP